LIDKGLFPRIRPAAIVSFEDRASGKDNPQSQGSEYPAVVIPLSTQHYPMLQRNLVYTGVTRGKRLVILVGQPKALAVAVKGNRARRRWSKLREWLGCNSPAVEPPGAL
jgi:hypothetical protein